MLGKSRLIVILDRIKKYLTIYFIVRPKAGQEHERLKNSRYEFFCIYFLLTMPTINYATHDINYATHDNSTQ